MTNSWKAREESRATLPHAVYRFYDAAGMLLWVGRTYNLEKRYYSHSRTAPWWPDVIRKTDIWYPELAAADAAETEAIENERPLYNVRKQAPMDVRAPDGIEPPRFGSRIDYVTTSLRRGILNGTYPSGSVLPPRWMMRQSLGTSSSAVGAGLQILIQEGLLTIGAARGVTVSSLRRYDVTVSLTRPADAGEAKRALACIAARSWDLDDYAVSGLSANVDASEWLWVWRMNILAPNAGSAAASGLAAAARTAGADWDFKDAAVGAEPDELAESA